MCSSGKKKICLEEETGSGTLHLERGALIRGQGMSTPRNRQKRTRGGLRDRGRNGVEEGQQREGLQFGGRARGFQGLIASDGRL